LTSTERGIGRVAMANPLAEVFAMPLRKAASYARNAVVTFVLCTVVLLPATLTAQNPPKKTKPPRPKQLDEGISLKRDPVSGELHLSERHAVAAPSGADPAPAPHALRVHVSLVPINCNVFAADGTAVNGLAQNDFRIYEDGVEQRVAYFDAATEPASVALVIDASPSELPDEQPEHTAARELADTLASSDQVAVVEFSAHSYVLAPFMSDRDELERAIKSIDVRFIRRYGRIKYLRDSLLDRGENVSRPPWAQGDPPSHGRPGQRPRTFARSRGSASAAAGFHSGVAGSRGERGPRPGEADI